ncbi:cyclic nucleotide-binding/patatin-like phospholipase domain-containing protein [Corallococcus coralloides DSM 2259]|uniref:Cyclic nucleotide-binding/patatin-like phospholipase domain-containing protein n=1 Tax=Corallococcus coralloides (strain ATCC 25202 / DSM 2259 / NBRC 100086 / M2) TaxID=1144275 RepID=H8MV28_CORCM|nr:cyclic nucleotide-binding and patatin-like phospholipase domain-containing protein [Corallococcus coralloides]AFE10789.1 cyclic nucleotide-binding/patatin-like phospholipase domain-containing protein [Corallococcus coralloides DSM 2259]
MASPLTVDERRRWLYTLKQAPVLRHARASALLHLLERARPVEPQPGEGICREGEPVDGIYLLRSGEWRMTAGGTVLLHLRSGMSLGVEALARGTWPVTVTAASASHALFLPRAELEAVAVAPRVGAAPRTDVVTFRAQQGLELPPATLSVLVELVAKVMVHDFGDRVLLVRAGTKRTEGAVRGADRVFRRTVTPGAPLLPEGEDFDCVLVDGVPVPESLTPREVRLVPLGGEADGLGRPGAPVLPTVLLSPWRPQGSPTLRGRSLPDEDGWDEEAPPPGCRLRLDWERLVVRPGDSRPLAALGLDAGTRDALSRWARAITGRRVGLALSGGGVWGFYHVHLLRRLAALDVPVDFLSSASMGSLVGAYYCGTARDGREGLDGLRRLQHRARGGHLSAAALSSVVTTQAMEWLVRGDLGDLALEELPMGFLPVTTDLTTGRCVVLEKGPLALAVRASGSAPGVWAPTLQPPARYVDGAFTSMVPVDVLLHSGADLIFSSNIFPAGHHHAARPLLPGAVGLFLSALNPVARAKDLLASGVLLLHRSGDLESARGDLRYDVGTREHPLLGSMRFTHVDEVLDEAARDMGLEQKLLELKQAWEALRGRRNTAGGRRAA